MPLKKELKTKLATAKQEQKAKKKDLVVKPVADYGVDTAPRLKIVKVAEPAKREAGVKVADAAELVSKLKTEAGVL